MNAAWFLGVTANQAVLPAEPSLPWWRVGLLVIIFLILLGIWGWVNRGRLNFRAFSLRTLLPTPNQYILFREQRWLNSRTVVFLVEVEGERFLLAQNPSGLAWQPLKKEAKEGEGKASLDS